MIHVPKENGNMMVSLRKEERASKVEERDTQDLFQLQNDILLPFSFYCKMTRGAFPLFQLQNDHLLPFIAK